MVSPFVLFSARSLMMVFLRRLNCIPRTERLVSGNKFQKYVCNDRNRFFKEFHECRGISKHLFTISRGSTLHLSSRCLLFLSNFLDGEEIINQLNLDVLRCIQIHVYIAEFSELGTTIIFSKEIFASMKFHLVKYQPNVPRLVA